MKLQFLFVFAVLGYFLETASFVSSKKCVKKTSGRQKTGAQGRLELKSDGKSSTLTTKDFESYLNSMPKFTKRLISKIPKGESRPDVFYPISINMVFQALRISADENSDSWNEVNNFLGTEFILSSPSWISQFDPFFKTMEIESSNFFATSEQNKNLQSVQSLSKDMGLSVITDTQDLITKVQEKTRRLPIDVQIKVPDDGVMFVNVVSIKFSWQFSFLRLKEPQPFYIGDSKSIMSNFMKSISFFNVFHEDENRGYSVIEIPFKKPVDNNLSGKHPSGNQGMAAYVIFDKHTGSVDLLELKDKLKFLVDAARKKISPILIELTMPAFELKSNFEFPRAHFPHLFKKINPDFSKIGQSTKVSVLHAAYMCADENGVVGTGLSQGNVRTISIGGPPKFVLDHEFIVVIADKNTGAPVAVAHVQKPLEGATKCQ